MQIGTPMLVGATAVAVVGVGAAAWMLTNRGVAHPGQVEPTGDDAAAPAAWKRTLAAMEYYAKAPDGSTRGFQIDAQVLGGSGFQRIGTSWNDALRAAHAAAATPLQDDIHAEPLNQAQAVLQAADGAYWVAPLGGFHRGTTDAIFIDGPFWNEHGVDVIAHSHTTDLKAIVGVDHVIDLRSERTNEASSG